MQSIYARQLNSEFKKMFRRSAVGKATRLCQLRAVCAKKLPNRNPTRIGLGPSCFEKKTAGAVLLAHPGIYTAK